MARLLDGSQIRDYPRVPRTGICDSIFLHADCFLRALGHFSCGSMSHGDPGIVSTMFVNWATFGVMGPGMFGFGMFVATEREQGLLRLKRALPMPTASYVLAKMAMTMTFAFIVMITLILAAVFIGHARITVGQYLLITLLNVLGSLSFCAIGLFIGARASAKSAPAFVNLAYLPMMHLEDCFIHCLNPFNLWNLSRPPFI